MIQARLLLSLLILLLVLPGRLWAADLFPGTSAEEPVDLEAAQLSFDDQAGRYLAKGNVRLKQGDLVLQSDELWWNQKSGDVEAVGSVVLEDPTEQLTGTKVHYNLNDETGFVENGRAFLREHNLRVSGERIEKRGASDYRVLDGDFTTCDGEVPAWKFAAGQLDVTVGGYARARNAVFYLKDIPSLYLPYIVYPAKTERESGLLTPRLGYSDRRGMELSAAYYQVISRNQDATLYLDYLSDLGVGKGLEYRYIFGRDNVGKAQGYHIDAKTGDNRYALAWEHEGTLPGRVRLSADTEYVSERDFFEDFGEEAGEYNKDQSLSVLSLTRNWGLFNLVGQLRYSKDLEKTDRTIVQWLPRISLDSVRQRIGATPFFYALGSEYTYFWRQEGLKSQRLRVRPVLLAPFRLWDTIDLVPQIGWTERHYWTSDEGAGHQHEGMYDFSTRLSSRFYRVFRPDSGAFTRVRHLVEPEIIYRYIPDVDQQSLPEFDSFDRVAEVNRVEYGLTQRVTTRTEGEDGLAAYRDLLFLRLSQNYDLLQGGMLKEHLSPLRGQLTLEPTDTFRFSADSRFDFERGRWSEYSGEVLLQDLRGNLLGFEYRRKKETEDEEQIDYGSMRVETAWLKPVYLKYQTRYDFLSPDQLEQVVDLEYRHQCWSVLMTLRERGEDKSVMLTFTLGGVGTVGSIGGNIGGS